VSDPLVRLSERISDEVVKINLAVQRAKRGWHDFQRELASASAQANDG
jgi:hypothetical protein